MRRQLRRLPRPLPALLAVTALGLVARLYALGWRMAHQDEARVAEWIVHFGETGVFRYRAIIHGPFVQHVNRVVFEVFGPSDFTMRLAVAVLGGLLPLSAWLFRERLRDSELVALAVLLAANPLLLYYSRFMRSDVPLVSFMFVAFGLLVRYSDTRDRRYLAAATAAFALGFTTKENAILYPACWLGAGALLLDHRLSLAAVRRDSVAEAAPPWLRRAGTWIVDVLDAVVAADLAALRELLGRAVRPVALVAGLVVEFFLIVIFFYAPRSPGVTGPRFDPGLWEAVADPTKLPALVGVATVGSWNEFASTWGGAMQGDSAYLDQFLALGEVLADGALVVVLLAGVGFLVDRYTGRRPNDVVAACFYWGAASVVGYPLAVDHPFPWELVHYIPPLAVPAAVALALIYRLGRDALAADDQVAVAAAAILLVLAGGWIGVTAVETSYAEPQSASNPIVQFAQPSGEMKPQLRAVRDVSATNEGTDVLFYGDLFDREANDTWEPGGTAPAGWFDRLPLPWYFSQYGTETASTVAADEATTDPPPVVIALTADSYGNPSYTADDVADRLADQGYVRYERQQYLTDRTLVFFFEPEAAPDVPTALLSGADNVVR